MKKNFKNNVTDYLSDAAYYAFAQYLAKTTKPVIKSKAFEIEDKQDALSIKFDRKYLPKDAEKALLNDDTINIKEQFNEFAKEASAIRIVNYFYRGIRIEIVFNQLGNIKVHFEHKKKQYNIDITDRDLLNVIHIAEINVNMAIQELYDD